MKRPKCGCGKIAYKTSKDAKVSRRKHRGLFGDASLGIYRCGEGFWHIGHAIGFNRDTKSTGRKEK